MDQEDVSFEGDAVRSDSTMDLIFFMEKTRAEATQS